MDAHTTRVLPQTFSAAQDCRENFNRLRLARFCSCMMGISPTRALAQGLLISVLYRLYHLLPNPIRITLGKFALVRYIKGSLR